MLLARDYLTGAPPAFALSSLTTAPAGDLRATDHEDEEEADEHLLGGGEAEAGEEGDQAPIIAEGSLTRRLFGQILGPSSSLRGTERQPGRVLVGGRSDACSGPVNAQFMRGGQTNGRETAGEGLLARNREVLEGTMADVENEHAHWAPPGKALPLGALYIHVLTAEDFFIQGMLKGGTPLWEASWKGNMGLSEPRPPRGQPWEDWARRWTCRSCASTARRCSPPPTPTSTV